MSAQIPPYYPRPPEPVPPPGYAPPRAAKLLPRRGALPLTLALLPLLAFAFFAPLILLGAGGSSLSPNRIWMHFREGGWGMWLVLLFQMMLSPAFLTLGALMIRGRRPPGSVLFMLALLPVVAAVFGVLTAQRMISGALSSDLVDASQRARIMAEGVSEMSNLTIYGSIAASCAMYVAAVIAVMSVASVDTTELAPAPRSAGYVIAMPLGFGAAIIAGALRVALHLSITSLDALVIFGLISAGLLASLGGKPLPQLVAARDEDEGSPAFRLLALAAVALTASTILMDRASSAVDLRTPLGAIAGVSADPLQRARILLDAVTPSYRGRPIVMAADAILCVAVFAAPLIAALAAKRKISTAGIAGGVVSALIAALALLASHQGDAAIASVGEPYARSEKAIADSGVSVPVIHALQGSTSITGSLAAIVKRDGSIVDQRTGSEGSPPSDLDFEDSRRASDVAADGALPFDTFASKVEPMFAKKRVSPVIRLVVAPAERLDLRPLGPFAALVGANLLAYDVVLNTKLMDGLPPARERYDSWRRSSPGGRARVLAVLPSGDTARLLVLSRLTMEVEAKIADALPLGSAPRSQETRRSTLSSIDADHPGIDLILIAPAAGATMSDVAAQLEAIASASAARTELGLTADRATLDQAPDAPSSTRTRVTMRDLSVLGSMPKDVVDRSLRRSGTMLGACYRNARAVEGADTPSEIGVRFVVDSTGSVKKTTVTSGKSRSLALCAEAAINALSFPLPSGGIVSVTVTVAFN